MEMKNFEPLPACTSSTRKRKAVAGGSSLKIGLVGCTNKEKRVSVPVPVTITCTSSKGETETLLPPSDDKTKDEEEWVHSVFSDSSDDLSDFERSFEDFIKKHDHISDEHEFDRQLNKEIVRRLFSTPPEKRPKLLNQKEKIWRLNVLLNRRSDITHNSCGEDVFQKLNNEGLINNIPKRTALAYINSAIRRKERFHKHDLTFELVKKLIIAVPCIRVKDSYFSYSRVANFVQNMGLANIPSDMLVQPLFYIKYKLSRIMESFEFHPVVHMDRIKETLSVVENDKKINRREWIQRWKNQSSLCFNEQIKREESEIKSSEDYKKALKVVKLHQEFNRHLASSSCLFMKHDMKIKNLITDKRVVESRFEGLDKALIKASLKARIKLLKKLSELDVYNAWLLELVDCRLKEGQSGMDEILQIIRAEHPDFPKLPDKWIFSRVRDIPRGWTDKMKQEELCSFYELLDKVKEHTRCPMSYAFVIDGISDYRRACSCIEDVWSVKSKDPSYYVDFDYSARTIWLKMKAWDEVCYDHPAYTAVYEDVSTLM